MIYSWFFIDTKIENIEMVSDFLLRLTLTCNFCVETAEFQSQNPKRDERGRSSSKQNVPKIPRIVDFVGNVCLYLIFSISSLRAAWARDFWYLLAIEIEEKTEFVTVALKRKLSDSLIG